MRHSPPRLIAAIIGLLACFGVAQTSAAQASVWYVAQSQPAGGDGHSWKTAFRSLQDALAASRKGDQIWVARGTYHPDPSDATKSFVLKEDVTLYGGFAGFETTLGRRDFRRNVTVLSGDIGKGDRTKNSNTVVIGADRAVLDGFTVADAYGAGEPRMHLVPADILKNDMTVGGGMRNFMTAPIVRNSIFRNNTSPKGGAVYNVHKAGAEQAQFINVDFIGNRAQMRGGAVSNDLGAMPRFINCRFLGNRSDDKGGALYNDFAASPLVVNSLFRGNTAVTAGGIGNDGGSAPLLVNVTVAGNKASSGLGSGLYQGTGANSNPILIDSVVDDIYNWHEDVVAEIGSTVPRGATVPLADFIPISNLKGELRPRMLQAARRHGRGYRPGWDGTLLLEDRLVAALLRFYVKNDGAVKYRGEYTRPPVTRPPVSASVLYVAPTSSAKVQDGLSWAAAMSDLQAAIELASVSKAAVWIKAGTYRPERKQDRIAAFILYDDVKLYGGFAGTETALVQRPTAGARTILSAATTRGGYRYPHVLYGADNVLLDGLTLRDGNATGFTYDGKGGGLLAYRAGKTFLPRDAAVGFAMTIQNCRFERNAALEGGAIYSFGKASLSISGTVFARNRASYGGAVVDREGSVTTYQDSVFEGNQAARDGGAAYTDYGAHVQFEQVVFRRNGARHAGGAVYELSRASQLEATVVSVLRSKFANNKAPLGSSIYNLDGSTLTIEDSDYPANSVVEPGAAGSQ